MSDRGEAGVHAVINVCFHGVGVPARALASEEEAYWLPEGDFYRILDECAQRDDVRLTFDGGNASDLLLVLPELVQRGLSAAFFPVVGRIGERGSLDADGLRALLAHGMTVGSLGLRHRPWPDADDDELAEELGAARERLGEILSSPIELAACPLGAYDHRVLRRLRALGYRAVYTADERPARPDAWLRPRFVVRAGDTVATLRATAFAPRPWGERTRATLAGTFKRWR